MAAGVLCLNCAGGSVVDFNYPQTIRGRYGIRYRNRSIVFIK